jgi:hypothetical protein
MQNGVLIAPGSTIATRCHRLQLVTGAFHQSFDGELGGV